MMKFEEMELVNYCYPGCIPLLNIMRLPREEAFELAAKMAEAHPQTTAFYRFADFDNYYKLREEQDAFLYRKFTEKGGKPKTEHPLSFVAEGSEYLKEWFGNGTETRIALKDLNPLTVSFTVGDSGALYQQTGTAELLTWNEMKKIYQRYNNLGTLLTEYGKQYVEIQLWTEKIPPVSDKNEVIR